jgi:hypothetical protein
VRATEVTSVAATKVAASATMEASPMSSAAVATTSAAVATTSAAGAAARHSAGRHCHAEGDSRNGRNKFPLHRNLSFLMQGRPNDTRQVMPGVAQSVSKSVPPRLSSNELQIAADSIYSSCVDDSRREKQNPRRCG